MSDAVPTATGDWTRRPTSPEVVRTLANVAAVGEIAIRKAANSAGGRALAAVIREYPLWSVFVASTLGYLMAGNKRPRTALRSTPPPAPVVRPALPPKPRP
jgi:hypothetical protein